MKNSVVTISNNRGGISIAIAIVLGLYLAITSIAVGTNRSTKELRRTEVKAMNYVLQRIDNQAKAELDSYGQVHIYLPEGASCSVTLNEFHEKLGPRDRLLKMISCSSEDVLVLSDSLDRPELVKLAMNAFELSAEDVFYFIFQGEKEQESQDPNNN